MPEPVLTVARGELILGGQKSDKLRRAENLATAWLAASPSHSAALGASAKPWDSEMCNRIARHQADRALRVPGLATVEEPLPLAEAITRHSRANTLMVVDFLTLWLTNLLTPAVKISAVASEDASIEAPRELHEKIEVFPSVLRDKLVTFLIAIQKAQGPLILVGNEIGLGLIPLGREVRIFVDTLGRLNQDMAAICQRVTLMAAGLPWVLKDVD